MTPITSPTTTARAATASATGAPGRPADSPEAAARQFEAVLVRQFVEVMTKDLFDGDAEGGLTGQADLQRDTLTDTLTDHLVESGTFGVADLMIAQWRRSGRLPAETDAPTATPGVAESSASELVSPPAGAARRPAPPGRDAGTSRPMTMDDALRLYAPAQGRPRSDDHTRDPLP